MSPPRVGVTLRARGGAAQGRGSEREPGWWLHDALLQRCAEIGALAWPLAVAAPTPASAIDALAQTYLEQIDALVLGGGADLVADAPDAAPAPAAHDLARDRFERALLAGARERRMPVLGICRGAQLIHRALGGSLLPPDVHASAIHLDLARYAAHHHAVALTPGTWLAAAFGGQQAQVGSAHRWRIGQPAPPARVLARCLADTSVEAFDVPGDALTLGVIWHPEFALDHPEALPGALVFDHFAAAIDRREL
ncbi:MAG: gamma-glutamyl-gamma-aminobutyrate hydrolase family protein [Rhodanobacteraceae bacterium]|nr:gamma-glutamyl-gamma-aminobutyrate hydrolase family protein [Rhodanobacteraceae bacterium]